MTYLNIDTTKLNTVITTMHKYSNSGVETTCTVFEYTLRHVTAKFAHMNGHWKAYIFRTLLTQDRFFELLIHCIHYYYTAKFAHMNDHWKVYD